MKKLLFLVLSLFLTACATNQWVDRDSGNKATEQINRICEFEAKKASAIGRTVVDRVSANVSVFRSCMYSKGYVLVRGK